MVPELVNDALMQKEPNDDVSQIIQELKIELLEVVGEQPSLSKETFLGDFTLEEYLMLRLVPVNKMFVFYSHIFDLTYKHIVPTGLKRAFITFFYKHIVPTGLKNGQSNEEYL